MSHTADCCAAASFRGQPPAAATAAMAAPLPVPAARGFYDEGDPRGDELAAYMFMAEQLHVLIVPSTDGRCGLPQGREPFGLLSARSLASAPGG